MSPYCHPTPWYATGNFTGPRLNSIFSGKSASEIKYVRFYYSRRLLLLLPGLLSSLGEFDDPVASTAETSVDLE